MALDKVLDMISLILPFLVNNRAPVALFLCLEIFLD